MAMLRRKSRRQQVNRVLVCYGHGFFFYSFPVFSLPLSPLVPVFFDFSAIKICYVESVEMDQRVIHLPNLLPNMTA